MSFMYPGVLLLLVFPGIWLVWEWRSTKQPLSLVLKVLSAACVVLALAQPALDINENKLAVAVLVDTSASMSDADLQRASVIADGLEKARGRNTVKVLPFARNVRPADPTERSGAWHLRRTAGDAAKSTDLEAALREGVTLLPAGQVPRLVLISDGLENRGSVTRAIWQARQLGVPIDTYALNGSPEPKLKLRSVQLPANAFTGERFGIEILVDSPEKTTGTVEVTAEGKTLGKSPVTLEPGANSVLMNVSIATPGAIDLAGTLSTESQGEARFEQAIHLRRPKLLYLTQDAAGMETHLFSVLAASQFDVVANVDLVRAKLDDYQIIVLNNWDLEAISPSRKLDLENYVKQGGGLLVIGGEKNIYVERKPGAGDALDRTLPATVAPPRSPEGTVVVLIMDKSSSMEGRKMELARIAAIGVIENLRPVDHVGVLIFDNSFQWAVPVRRAQDRTMIKRLVAGITPDGGTQIAPALSEAYRRVVPTQGAYKHIVLLTDGISEEGDSMTVAREAALQRITISTVGLGQDVNRAYLEKIAAFAKGKSYFLTDPSGLEQILLKDVMEHTGSTTVEKPIKPEVMHKAEILEGVPMESAPALKGYVRFAAKPTADTLLKIDKEDPLFSRWQYGLGRAAVFTSDAKTRWAEAWVSWNGFDRFWANVLHDLLPHAQSGEAAVTYDGANGDLVVDYRLARSVKGPDAAPPIFAFGPAGFQQPVDVKKNGEGSWRGRVHIGERQGLFRVRPVTETPVFPEVGLYRPEAEVITYGSNESLLRQMASYTGGRFNPEPRAVFRAPGQSIPATLRLWPGLLGAAVLLNLAELLRRKGGAILSAFHEWRSRSAAPAA